MSAVCERLLRGVCIYRMCLLIRCFLPKLKKYINKNMKSNQNEMKLKRRKLNKELKKKKCFAQLLANKSVGNFKKNSTYIVVKPSKYSLFCVLKFRRCCEEPDFSQFLFDFLMKLPKIVKKNKEELNCCRIHIFQCDIRKNCHYDCIESGLQWLYIHKQHTHNHHIFISNLFKNTQKLAYCYAKKVSNTCWKKMMTEIIRTESFKIYE